MSTGSQADIQARLQGYLPKRWFGDFSLTPIVNGLLAGIANSLAVVYTLIQFVQAQTRLTTSSGGWIAFWAQDFLGTTLPRNPGESDAAYIARIKASLLLQKSTRPAMYNALLTLTGNAPIIFEPARPADTCNLGKNSGPNSYFGVGRFGSINCAYKALITVKRPSVAATVNAGNAFFSAAAWTALGTPLSHGYFASLADSEQVATDASIYSTIEAVRPVATEIGVAIVNQLPTGNWII